MAKFDNILCYVKRATSEITALCKAEVLTYAIARRYNIIESKSVLKEPMVDKEVGEYILYRSWAGQPKLQSSLDTDYEVSGVEDIALILSPNELEDFNLSWAVSISEVEPRAELLTQLWVAYKTKKEVQDG